MESEILTGRKWNKAQRFHFFWTAASIFFVEFKAKLREKISLKYY